MNCAEKLLEPTIFFNLYIVYTKRQVILLIKTFAKISPKNHKSIVLLLSNISQHYSIQGQC